MDRRGFLRSMLALSMAPAIVRAESLMKIYVPPEPKILTFDGTGDYLEIPDQVFDTDMSGDFTIDSWVRSMDPTGWSRGWTNISLVRTVGKDGIKSRQWYKDGEKASGAEIAALAPGLKMEHKEGILTFVGSDLNFHGLIDDLKIMDGVAMPPVKREHPEHPAHRLIEWDYGPKRS